MTATISERAIAGIGHNSKPKTQRVACPNCEATFDIEKAGKPRSPEQHKRFWALMNAAFHHWPEMHEQKFSTVNEARAWLTMKAGWRELKIKLPLAGVRPEIAIVLATAAMRAAGSNAIATHHKGQLCIWTPKSIRFDKMKHLEFCSLNQAVEDVIKAELEITGDELLEQHKGSI